MKLNKEFVKGVLKVALAKQGYSIQDLEKTIATQELAKESADKKKGGSPIDPLPGLGGFVFDSARVLGGISGALGGVTGIGAYGAYKEFKDSDTKINKLMETKRKIESATREIESLKAQKLQGGNF